MFWPLGLAVLAVFFIMLARRRIMRDKAEPTEGYPYVNNPVLFTPAERSLLRALEQAVGKDYRILGKVRVADVVSVRSMTDRGAWQRAFNRISAKHFDFILCAKDTLAVRCAIELNDKSHEAPRRQQRDAFLEGVCREISLPLVEIPARRDYSIADLQERLLAALKSSPEAQPLGRERGFSVGHVSKPQSQDQPWTIA